MIITANWLSCSGIYRIVHIPSGQHYIGATNCLLKRWEEHVRRLKKGNHNSRQLQELWDNDLPQNFQFEVIEVCPFEQLNEREKFYQQQYGAQLLSKRLGGYNSGMVRTKKINMQRKIQQRKNRPSRKGIPVGPAKRMELTQSIVDQLQAQEKRFMIWDTHTKGLAIEVMTSGTKVYRYRKVISCKDYKLTIGNASDFTLEQARQHADLATETLMTELKVINQNKFQKRLTSLAG